MKISKFSNTRIVDSKCEDEFFDTSEISLSENESDWLFELILTSLFTQGQKVV